MVSLIRSSKKLRDDPSSTLSAVKSKPQLRKSAMNDSIWSGITSLKNDLGVARSSYPKPVEVNLGGTNPEGDVDLLRDEEEIIFEEEHFTDLKFTGDDNALRL
jgi:hypothetical protein